MINLLLPIMVIGYCFFKDIKQKCNILFPSTITLLLYFVSVCLAFPYVFLYKEERVFQFVYLEASIVFCFLLFIFLQPFIFIRGDNIKKIILPNSKFLYLFSLCICVLSIYSVIYFIPTTIIAFNVPSISDARDAMVYQGDIITNRTVFNTIAGTVASFYHIPIILFFIYQILGTNKKLKIMLFLSSTSYVFFVFSAFGRDGVLFWIISLMGFYGLFKKYLEEKFRRKFKYLLLISTLIGGSGFIIITLSRFEGDVFNSIISYMGQSFPNFCFAYEADVSISQGNCFPLFRSILGLPEEATNSAVIQKYQLSQQNTYSYVFGTFLKSFILDFGLVGTFLIAVIMFLLFKISVHNRDKITLQEIFIYSLYFQILYQGVFYYRQYNRVGNLLIIVMFFLYILFNIIMKKDATKSILFCSKNMK